MRQLQAWAEEVKVKVATVEAVAEDALLVTADKADNALNLIVIYPY